MKRVKYLFFIALCLCVVTGATSCKDENTSEMKIMTVASRKIDCFSEGRQTECFVVKYEGSDVWQKLEYPIHYFDWQAGYEYVVRVEVVYVKNPGIYEPVMKYLLQEVVSKEKKDSDMPFARCLTAK